MNTWGALLYSLTVSLLLTEAIETAVCFALGFRGGELLIVLLANIATNPAVVFVCVLAGKFTHVPQWLCVGVLEVSAVLVEALIYRRATDRKRPFLDSLIANAVSYSTGLMLTAFA